MKIGKIFGIEIILDWGWFIIFAVLSFNLGADYFPQVIPGLNPYLYWILGIVTVLGLFGSVLFHELCHSFVAANFGMRVQRIILCIFGGMAEFEKEFPSAGAEFYTAVVGPLSSLGLTGLFWMGCLITADGLPILFAVLNYLFLINLLLAIFNLIPGFPLDGGRVLMAAIWHYSGNMTKATRIACRSGEICAFLVMGCGVLLLVKGNLSGLWLLYVGSFLLMTARSSWKQYQEQYQNPDDVQ